VVYYEYEVRGEVVLVNEVLESIKTMLGEIGYSEKAIREILKWYI